MEEFHETDPLAIKENVFDLIGNQWMLITAGNEQKYNTMTASWGGLGVLWSRNVAFCFVRPQRYTYEFIDHSDYYSLSFYDKTFRPALNFCGSKSGRDYDKAAETGLEPVFSEGTVYFRQAKLVLICKKLYARTFEPEFFTACDAKEIYPDGDFHKAFIGEITHTLIR